MYVYMPDILWVLFMEQDFTTSYTDVATKCENLAYALLSTCKTTHEVQMLLQTRKAQAGKCTVFWSNPILCCDMFKQ